MGTDVPDFETYVGSKLRANVENEPNRTVNDIDENQKNESRKSIDETMMKTRKHSDAKRQFLRPE